MKRLTGWLGNLDDELRTLDRYRSEQPARYTPRAAKDSPFKDYYERKVLENLGEKFVGIDSGFSFDALLEATLGVSLDDLPAQTIGSCVAEGGQRVFAFRTLAEILIYGQFEKLMGHELTGVNSICSYGPYNYYWGRYHANILGGGDGSWCQPHIRGFMEQGVVDCNHPSLKGQLPSPSNNKDLYRLWGGRRSPAPDFQEDGKKIRLLESERLQGDSDRTWEVFTGEHKPQMVCSDWAFKPVRYLPEYGFWLYTRDLRDSWGHNMSRVGAFESVRGDRFLKVLNSWGKHAHKDGGWFVIAWEEAMRWERDSVTMTIGEIDLPDINPVPLADLGY